MNAWGECRLAEGVAGLPGILGGRGLWIPAALALALLPVAPGTLPWEQA